MAAQVNADADANTLVEVSSIVRDVGDTPVTERS
jgi:hypothetical protein